MQILWLDEVDSTQDFILQKLKSEEIRAPYMVVAKKQTSGKGSRGNQWDSMEGNLFLSFVIDKKDLPNDLPLSATSIYFSYILKDLLETLGSAVWVKWPNDFYIKDKKIGGTITNVIGNILICGIGINLKKAPNGFSHLDIDVDIRYVLKSFTNLLKNCTPWKKVLKKFEVEFERSKNFYTHDKNEKISLVNAHLCEDGTLIVDGKRIYSLR